LNFYYYNILPTSWRLGNITHPAGSSAIKEMFTAEGVLQGWAVTTKIRETTDDGGSDLILSGFPFR
jgi:hypothetical protein